MESDQISCVYYPTTCVVVDDQITFLDNIIFKIDSHTICKTFTDPHDALEYIQKSKKNEFLPTTMSIEPGAPDPLPSFGKTPLQLNISDLHRHIYEKNRFDEISVIIVDFQMPIMNGAEFCRELQQQMKGNAIKIIMLTGEADENLAVQLFNDGAIHRFIRKGAPNVYELLNNSIKEMQRLYFQTNSNPIINGLSVNQDLCIKDPLFIDIFEKTYKKIGESSYYLIDSSGSYIFIDDNKIPTWLIVKTQHELNDFAEQMEKYEIEDDLVNKVRQGSLIPYFYNFDNCIAALLEKHDFKNYLLPGEKVKSKKDFSYCITTKLPGFHFESETILSFKDFIAK